MASPLHPFSTRLHLFDIVVWAAPTGNGEDNISGGHAWSGGGDCGGPLISHVLDHFTQFGLGQGSKFRWAIAPGQSEICSDGILVLKQKLRSLTAGIGAAISLGIKRPWGATPSLLEPEEGRPLVRQLASRARVLICLSAMPGPEDALAKACVESSTDLVIAGMEADAPARQWVERHGRLARLTGSRLVLMPGLASAAPEEQVCAALAVARALLDPGRSCSMLCMPGIHKVSRSAALEGLEAELGPSDGRPVVFALAKL